MDCIQIIQALSPWSLLTHPDRGTSPNRKPQHTHKLIPISSDTSGLESDRTRARLRLRAHTESPTVKSATPIDTATRILSYNRKVLTKPTMLNAALPDARNPIGSVLLTWRGRYSSTGTSRPAVSLAVSAGIPFSPFLII